MAGRYSSASSHGLSSCCPAPGLPLSPSSILSSTLSSIHIRHSLQRLLHNNLKKLHVGNKGHSISVQCIQKHSESQNHVSMIQTLNRRHILHLSTSIASTIWFAWLQEETVEAATFADMPALRGKDYGKTKMRYSDFIETSSGLQYKDLRVGSGPIPKVGETVVIDWDGYTIGYYGRIFEAQNKAKGGSFEGSDKSYYKFKVGTDEVIPAFEEAVSTMAVGGVRRIIVPPELGYPDNDFTKKGPSPTTFSGQRALAFVLKNQGLIDKTLLFDIQLLKVIT